MATDSPEAVSSEMQPKYVNLEYCFILKSLYWMFSGFDFLILCLLPNKMDFAYLHQNEYLHFLMLRCNINIASLFPKHFL